MNSNELHRFRARIESELADLERSVAEIEAEFRSSSENSTTAAPDFLDSAKSETDLNTRSRIHNHSVARQNELRRALARVETGQFGICHECEEYIDLRRLEAVPATTLCVRCQNEQEKVGLAEPRLRSGGPEATMLWGSCGQFNKLAA